MNRFLNVFLTNLLLIAATAVAQEPDITWERSKRPVDSEIILFHSAHAVNLETAKTLKQGNFEFQIYHRFIPPISNGYEDFYGLDGRVNIRLGLGYAVTDRLFVTLARTNVIDQIDLRAKYRLYENNETPLPVMLAAQGGVGWNTNIPNRDDWDGQNFQYYIQGIVNTVYRKKIGLGIVPAYLNNGNVFGGDRENSYILGAYAQYWIMRRFSVLTEWSTVLDGFGRDHDNWTIALELQTAGHFFKVLVTNSLTLNPSQYMLGATRNFDPDNWRIGFNITRLLAF